MVSPSWAVNRVTVPSTSDSTSISTLSVATTATAWPLVMVSPTEICQLRNSPSSIVMDIFGMRMGTSGIVRLLREPAGGDDDVRDLGDGRLLQLGGVRHGRVQPGEPDDRGLERVEGVGLDDPRGDLGDEPRV